MVKKVILLFFLVIATLTITSCMQTNTEGIKDSIVTSQLATEPENANEINSILANEIDLEDTKITAIADILERSGIVKINKVEFITDYDDNGLIYSLDAVTSRQTSIDLMLCLLSDGSVDEINVKMRDTQIYADGEIQYGFLTKDEENTYKVSSQLMVQELLLSPSSAKFPTNSNWNMFRKQDSIIIQSTVESKNALGVDISSKFQVKWVKGNPVSLILDGKEYL